MFSWFTHCLDIRVRRLEAWKETAMAQIDDLTAKLQADEALASTVAQHVTDLNGVVATLQAQVAAGQMPDLSPLEALADSINTTLSGASGQATAPAPAATDTGAAQ